MMIAKISMCIKKYNYIKAAMIKRLVKTTFGCIIFLTICFAVNKEYFSSKKSELINLCPNVNFGDSKIANSKIAVVIIIIKEDDFDDFKMAVTATECYTKHFGYQFHLITIEKNVDIQQECKQGDIYFKQHCALAWFLEKNKETIEYALYLDADMGVINPCHTIQEYIDTDEKIEITFYERYFNHEIAAGSYLLKNTQASRNFLLYWSNYNLPDSFHGTDNGALHQILMEYHFANSESKMQCYELWNKSKNYDDLFEFEACTKNALFSNSTLFVNNTIKIIRKMIPGWVRDGWLTDTKWASQDFMFHGWKKSKLGWEWNYPFKNKFDLNQCKFEDFGFPNFNYKTNFTSTRKEIEEILQLKTTTVNKKYSEILYKLNLINKNL